jgi:hypothetical protein
MFWSGETLSERLKTLIEPFVPGRVDCAAYILHQQALRDLRYEVLTIWECETRDGRRLREAVAAFFGGLPSRGQPCA